MTITLDKTTTEEELNAWLEKVRDKRKKAGDPPRMAKYFGILPDIGDGLKIQKELRNEWD